MYLSRCLTHLDILMHSSLKSKCASGVQNRCFTRQGKTFPINKLTWDSIRPAKKDEQSLSQDDPVVDAAAEASYQAKAAAAAAAAAAEALAAANMRHLSLTPDDAKFLRSGVSPLDLRPDDAELIIASDRTKKRVDRKQPASSQHWGRVTEPAASPKQLNSAASQPVAKQLNPTYDACARNDWARVFLRPAVNPWQELIQLTAEGKLWHYPIDNEQGCELEPDSQLSFQRHVMLERHLQDWVPKTGPVRHFMETVCIGLSKNHHLTVAEKVEHLDWFKRYFADKMDQIQVAYDQSVDN